MGSGGRAPRGAWQLLVRTTAVLAGIVLWAALPAGGAAARAQGAGAGGAGSSGAGAGGRGAWSRSRIR